MTNSGWICLHRKIIDNWIWEDPEKLRAWLDILLMVNHEDKQIPFNGHIITVRRGEKLTSIKKLAERWGWNRKRVMRFLKLLEESEMCLTKRTANGTTIFVQNYGLYQDIFASDGTTKGTTRGTTTGTTVGTTVGTQTTMNNNDKQLNKYGRSPTHTTPPTVDDVRVYCEARGNGLDPELFVDYYSMRDWKLKNGQPMKDWKASVRYWEKNQNKIHPDNDPKQKNDYEDFEKELFG